MKISENGVCLRALAHSDADLLLRWHNDPELYSSLGGHFRYVSREKEAEWLRLRIEAQDEVNLAICLLDPPKHIGNIYLRGIDWVAKNCELHTFIAEPGHRGKGYGFTAISLIVKHAFEDLGLARIYLHVLAKNVAAIGVYEKCGFAVEGRLRSHAFKAGKFEDVLVMGICREQ